MCTCQSSTQGSLGRAMCMTQGDMDCVFACHLCFLTYLGRCCHPLMVEELRLRDRNVLTTGSCGRPSLVPAVEPGRVGLQPVDGPRGLGPRQELNQP